MKINKISVITGLALGGLVACSNMAMAQQGGGGRKGPSVEQRLERMTDKLKLTDEEKPKVKAVLEDSQKKMQELRSDSSVPREERRGKMKDIMDNEDKKMKGILTPDQYTEYEKMKQQMAADRKNAKKAADDTKKE